MFIKSIFIAILFFTISVYNQTPAFAQDCNCNAATETCVGGYCVERAGGTTSTVLIPNQGALGFLISRAYAFLLPILGMVGFASLLYSGYQFLISKGDPKGLESAKARMTYTIVGLVIIALAYIISLIVQSTLGIGVPQPI